MMKKFLITSLIFCASFIVADIHAAEEEAAVEKITYDDHILPIFRQRCGSCHNASDQKGGLVLDNFNGLMAGGGSGGSVEPGDASSSYLYMVINHDSEPFMPPNQPKMPEKELTLIKEWIDMGALQNKGSKVVKKKNDLAKIEISTERPADAPVMPISVPLAPVHTPNTGNSVTALACSPWAPLAAISGFEQILLYDTSSGLLAGVLPFPEGTPQILKFSRNGQLLMAGGGQGGASGRVIVFDIKTGNRVAELGNEYDSVLAADISSDHAMVVLCGPKRMIRVFSVQTGEQLYEKKKHTDWITAAEFSPDGVLLATADRSNGMTLWEAMTGNEYLNLKGHTGAITDVSWRPDSNLVASSSEDGTIRLWELNDGNEVKRWNAHGGGVSAMDYTRDGNIISIGRDRVVKLWQADGKEIKAFGGLPDLGMEVAFDAESNRAIGGDWTGDVRVWDASTGTHLFSLATNPPGLSEQMATSIEQLKQAESKLKSSQDSLAALNNKIAARQQAVTSKKQDITNREMELTQANTQKDQLKKQLDAATAELAKKSAEQKSQEGTIGQLKKEVESLTKTANDKKAAVATATQQKQTAENQVSELNKKIEEAKKQEGEEGQKAVAALEQQLATAQQQLDAQTKSHAEAVQAQTATDAALAAKQKQVTDLETALAATKKAVQEMTVAAQNADKAFKDQEANVKKLLDSLPELKKQLAELEKVAPITEDEKKQQEELAAQVKQNESLVALSAAHKQKLEQQLAGSQQASAQN